MRFGDCEQRSDHIHRPMICQLHEGPTSSCECLQLEGLGGSMMLNFSIFKGGFDPLSWLDCTSTDQFLRVSLKYSPS